MARSGRFILVLAAAGLVWLPAPAWGNAPWEVALLRREVFARTWWAVAIGLFVEIMAVNWIADTTWKRSAVMATTMNAASLAVWIVLRRVLCPWLGTMRLLGNLLQVLAVSGAVESGVLFGLFGLRFSWTRLGLLIAVNIASTVVMVAALLGASRAVWFR